MVGGGPAGALAARQLAAFGLGAALVHTPLRRRQHLGETLSASAPRLLGSWGLDLPGSVYAPRPADHFVRWGGREDRIAAQPNEGRGEGQRLVRRDRLDSWAIGEAGRVGVRIVEGAATRCIFRHGEAVVAVKRPGAGDLAVRSRAVVDASGRSGALTRANRDLPGFRTTALTRHYPPGPRPGTLIASFPDGWVWSAPVVAGRRDVTVMRDAEDASDPGRAFREAVRQVDLAGLVAARGPMEEEPLRAADVTPYSLPRPALAAEGVPLIAVGDAASALDPLTGLGTMKAIHSGLTGAVVVRTALERPDHAGFALGFHAARERGLAAETGDRIAAFYAEETRYANHRFWRRRSRPAPSRRERRVQAPLWPEDRLVPAPGARIKRCGVLEGDWILPAEALALPGRHRPARRFAGIELVHLFRTLGPGKTAARILADFPASERTLRAALAFLLRDGFLRLRE